MEVKAQAKFQRIAPKKARIATFLIRGKKVDFAASMLKDLPKKSSDFVLKVLLSAKANAINNFGLRDEDLIVKEAFVDEGPTLERFRPRAFGRAGKIRKRKSHITVILENIEKKEKENKTSKNESKNQEQEKSVSAKSKSKKVLKDEKSENQENKKSEKKSESKKEKVLKNEK